MKSKIKFLCSQAGVSRSGFYNYISSKDNRNNKEIQDLESKKIILKAFNKRGFKKGARSIRMTLEKDFDILFNFFLLNNITEK